MTKDKDDDIGGLKPRVDCNKGDNNVLREVDVPINMRCMNIISIRVIFHWIFGLIFLLLGLIKFKDGQSLSAVIALLGSIILSPSSGRLWLVIVLILVMFVELFSF